MKPSTRLSKHHQATWSRLAAGSLAKNTVAGPDGPAVHLARQGRPGEPWWGRAGVRQASLTVRSLWHDTSARRRYPSITAHVCNCRCEFVSEKVLFWQSRGIWLDPTTAEYNCAIRGRCREAAAPPTCRGRRYVRTRDKRRISMSGIEISLARDQPTKTSLRLGAAINVHHRRSGRRLRTGVLWFSRIWQ